MNKKEKIKIILLTVLTVLLSEFVIYIVLQGTGLVNANFVVNPMLHSSNGGSNHTVTVTGHSGTKASLTTTSKSNAVTLSTSTSKAGNTTTAKANDATTRKNNTTAANNTTTTTTTKATTTTTTANNGGDNDGGWVDGWY